MKRTLLSLAINGVLVVGLASCAVTPTYTDQAKTFNEAPDATSASLLERQQTQFKAVDLKSKSVLETSAIWIDKRATKTIATQSLPPVLQQRYVISTSVQSPTLQEIGTLITKSTNLPVGFSADLAAVAGRGAADPSSKKATVGVFPFEGPLVDLLSIIATQNNAWWRWTGDRIEFYQYETKSFSISAPTGSSETKSNFAGSSTTAAGGGSGGGQAGAQSTQGATFSSKNAFWTEMREALGAYRSSRESIISVMESLSSVTIRETPSAMAMMETYISQLNERATRQVLVKFDIYLVSGTAGNNFALNWNAVYRALGGTRYSISAGQQVAAAPTLTAAVVDATSRWANSFAVLSTLSQQGSAKLLTSGTVIALNGRVVPIGIFTETTYLASISSNSIANAGVSVSLTPGTVTDGINSLITPTILDDGDIILDYKMDLSSLNGIETIRSGTQSIQAPSKSTRIINMTPQIRSGQSVVIAGYQQAGSTSNKQGPISPSAWILGGAFANKYESSSLVIVLTPTLIAKSPS